MTSIKNISGKFHCNLSLQKIFLFGQTTLHHKVYDNTWFGLVFKLFNYYFNWFCLNDVVCRLSMFEEIFVFRNYFSVFGVKCFRNCVPTRNVFQTKYQYLATRQTFQFLTYMLYLQPTHVGSSFICIDQQVHRWISPVSLNAISFYDSMRRGFPMINLINEWDSE